MWSFVIVSLQFSVDLRTVFKFNGNKTSSCTKIMFFLYCHIIPVSTGTTCWHSDSLHVMAITIKLCSNVSLLLYNLLPHVGIKSGWAFLFGSIPTSWTARTFKEMLLPKNITKMKVIEYDSFQHTFCIKFHETSETEYSTLVANYDRLI